MLLFFFSLNVEYTCRILAAHEAGLIKMWLQKHTPRNVCPGLKAKAEMVELPIEDAVGLFMILAVGIAIAVFVILLELWTSSLWKWKRTN